MRFLLRAVSLQYSIEGHVRALISTDLLCSRFATACRKSSLSRKSRHGAGYSNCTMLSQASLTFLSTPSPIVIHTSFRSLKCTRPQSRTLQPRASLNASREALFNYLAAKTSGAPRDQSRLRVLLDNVKLSVEDAWLLLAARVGDGEMVQKLLDDGADPNVADSEGSTPLMRAVSRGHVDASRVLLDDQRVDISKQNDWGYDAVIYLGSVQNSKPEAFKRISALMDSRGIQSSRSDLRWTQKPKRR